MVTPCRRWLPEACKATLHGCLLCHGLCCLPLWHVVLGSVTLWPSGSLWDSVAIWNAMDENRNCQKSQKHPVWHTCKPGSNLWAWIRTGGRNPRIRCTWTKLASPGLPSAGKLRSVFHHALREGDLAKLSHGSCFFGQVAVVWPRGLCHDLGPEIVYPMPFF